MYYYEIAFQITIKEDLHQKNVIEKISSGIDYCLFENECTRQIHKSREIKLYNFYLKDLCPLKTGSKTILIIRTMNKNLQNNLKYAILQKNNDCFIAENIVYETIKKRNKYNKILAVKTISPAVLTFKKNNISDKTRYMDSFTFNKKEVIDRINKNLEKKYSVIYNEKIVADCIADIIILNDIGIVSNYKKGIIIGNKYLIKFKKDELSQKLAFIAMGCGILEKNSLGFGVCFANNDYLYDFGGNTND